MGKIMNSFAFSLKNLDFQWSPTRYMIVNGGIRMVRVRGK